MVATGQGVHRRPLGFVAERPDSEEAGRAGKG
jgi:hypothetical protein